MNKQDYDNYNKIQQEKYSPTPKIKIKKWYEKVCSACIYSSREFGDYDNVGWCYCSKDQRIGNLKSFPKCNAKSCNEFEAESLLLDDGWNYMSDFEQVFSKSQYMSRLMNYLKFNERMGDYKIGRIL